MENSQNLLRRILLPVWNVILPALLFYWIYKAAGILPAVICSVLYNGIVLGIQYKKRRTVSNTSVIGLLGLLGSAIAICFTGNEKLYYVPALAVNVIVFCFMLSLHIRKKSVLHYLAKDFEIKAVERLPQEQLLSLNILWMVFFGLKIAAKVIGLLYLDFEKLYLLVFLLGDPAMIAVIVFSVIIIRRSQRQIQK